MEQKNNSGAIFKNEKKADNHPDYKGVINVEGKPFDIALWLKTSAAGVKYFGVKISEPYKKEAKPVITEAAQDDLPF